MLGSLLNIFKVPELRQKIKITLLLLLVYRIGAHVPCPFVDLQAIAEFAKRFSAAGGGKSGVFGMVNLFSGGAFQQMTIFALGIMPYITASIILQLLTVVWPRLERIAKEGEAGRKKINQYTRYGTVLLAAFQSIGLAVYMLDPQQSLSLIPDHRLLFIFTTMVAMTTGTCFIMWLGEKITEHGIGNGISLIIAVGIIASYPGSIMSGVQAVRGGMASAWLVVVPILFVALTGVIVLMQQANRKIPIQYARRMVGRREVRGGTNYLPLKINTAGVIPVIFASSILMFPSLVFGAFGGGGGFANLLSNALSSGQNPANLYRLFDIEMGGAFLILKSVNPYTLLYALLTVFFCFFYTAITFNPVDTADNLKRVGAFIPGRRPGKATSDYIDYVLTRITVVGSVFLVVVALIPNVLNLSFNVDAGLAYLVGGTGLIIVAGVLLDLMKQIESQLLMRHYEGFKYRSRGGGRGAQPGRRIRPAGDAATRKRPEGGRR